MASAAERLGRDAQRYSSVAIAFHWREKEGYYYPDSNWQLPFVGGYQFQKQPGTLNLDGSFRARVTAMGDDSVLARMVSLLRDAQSRRAPVVQ